MRKVLMGGGAVVLAAVAGVMLLSTHEKVESATIAVEGMACNNCENRVEAALAGIDGVKTAEASLADRLVRVTYVAPRTDVAALEKAIADLGYNAGNTKAEKAHSAEGEHSGSCDDKGSSDCCTKKALQPSA